MISELSWVFKRFSFQYQNKHGRMNTDVSGKSLHRRWLWCDFCLTHSRHILTLAKNPIPLIFFWISAMHKSGWCKLGSPYGVLICLQSTCTISAAAERWTVLWRRFCGRNQNILTLTKLQLLFARTRPSFLKITNECRGKPFRDC